MSEPTTAARPILESTKLSPEALSHILKAGSEPLAEVIAAVSKHDLVVVGMAQNPHVRKVRQMLDEAGLSYEYLEYGSYFSAWRPRLAIKMWSGWPTFPQVFVKGTLVGGEDLTRDALANGSLKERLGK